MTQALQLDWMLRFQSQTVAKTGLVITGLQQLFRKWYSLLDFGVPFAVKENWDNCVVKPEQECAAQSRLLGQNT